MRTCKDCLYSKICSVIYDCFDVKLSYHNNEVCGLFEYKLPCKVGDKVYFVNRGKIEEFIIEDINYSAKHKNNTLCLANTENLFDTFTTIFEHMIGYRLFLTIEEAEMINRGDDSK